MSNPVKSAEVRSGIFLFPWYKIGNTNDYTPRLRGAESIKDGWPTVKVPSLWCGVKLLRFLSFYLTVGGVKTESLLLNYKCNKVSTK